MIRFSMLQHCPYVDADRIAVSGHSRGGNTIHESVLLDNELETPLIKAILYVGRDAIYRDNETASFGYFRENQYNTGS